MNYSLELDETIVNLFRLAVGTAGESEEQVMDRLMREYIAQVIRSRSASAAGKSESCMKARRKLELWYRRPEQICSQILAAFFRCEQDGKAAQEEMACAFEEKTGLSRRQFETNLSSMCTEKGKSHGHVFDRFDGQVRLAPEIEVYAREMQGHFTI